MGPDRFATTEATIISAPASNKNATLTEPPRVNGKTAAPKTTMPAMSKSKPAVFGFMSIASPVHVARLESIIAGLAAAPRTIIYPGLDVHKESIAIAVLPHGAICLRRHAPSLIPKRPGGCGSVR